MKLIIFLTLLLGVAAALENTKLDERARHPHKKTSRPKKYSGAATMRVPKRPANCPDAYKTSMDKPTHQRSKATLKRLPSTLIDPDLKRRRESFSVLRKLRRQTSTPNDFYECTNPNPAPSTADCDVVVDQVLATNDELVVAANSCLTFSYQTCEGFFCSLCQTLNTTTDFIGNELDNAEALCVENGQAGTVVGEDAPQWDAGFVYQGQGLPTFDVC